MKDCNDKEKCFYCGIKLTDGNRTKDHIEPVSRIGNKNKRYRGGLKNNRVWACRWCNQNKGDMHLDVFMKMPYYKQFCRKI